MTEEATYSPPQEKFSTIKSVTDELSTGTKVKFLVRTIHRFDSFEDKPQTARLSLNLSKPFPITFSIDQQDWEVLRPTRPSFA